MRVARQHTWEALLILGSVNIQHNSLLVKQNIVKNY